MSQKKVKLIFPPHVLNEPILFNLTQQFHVITNIQLADIRGDMGWLVLEIEGEPDQIDNGLVWLNGMGIRVENIG